jgi:hypothetical protein
MDKKTRDAIKAGAEESPLAKKIAMEEHRKEILERAKKEFLKSKKKVYANEHPKFGNNNPDSKYYKKKESTHPDAKYYK